MIKYIVKRVLLMIPMLVLALIISWVLAQLMFVDPVLNKMGMLDIEIIEAERIRIGFYDPWYVKLGLYLKNFFTGNWGTSYLVSEGEPVSDLIGKIFPKTIELVIIPIIVIPILSVKLGVISAKNKDKPKDTVIRGISILGTALPIFWLATMLQYFVGHYLNIYTYGELNLEIMNPNSVTFRYPDPAWPNTTGFRLIDSILYNNQALLQDTLVHMILPMICMTFVSLAGVTRQTRASMLDVLEQDYIRTARAKGSLEKDVINRHALRNALIPTSTLIVGGTAARLTGALFLEIAFNYTGMGFYIVAAIRLGDYVVINGILVFTVIIILSGTLIADVLYTIIDPRIIYN